MNYSASTYRSSNPLRRFAHNARFAYSAKLVSEHCGKNDRVLDYGSGDGHFLDVLAEHGFSNVIGYDPLPIIRRQDVVSSLDGVRQVDCITCLETLEHVTAEQTEDFLADARRLLKPGGTVIISVPVMIGPVAVLKMLPDVLRGKLRDFGYTPVNLLKCVVGRPPTERKMAKEGIYYHMGFDHRRLRAKLQQFHSIRERTSPFPLLPAWANSQVFFICSHAVG